MSNLLWIFAILIVVLGVLALGVIVIGATRANKYRRKVDTHSNTAPIPPHEERNPQTRRDSPAASDVNSSRKV